MLLVQVEQQSLQLVAQLQHQVVSNIMFLLRQAHLHLELQLRSLILLWVVVAVAVTVTELAVELEVY
jgi:hypothetical protein